MRALVVGESKAAATNGLDIVSTYREGPYEIVEIQRDECLNDDVAVRVVRNRLTYRRH